MPQTTDQSPIQDEITSQRAKEPNKVSVGVSEPASWEAVCMSLISQRYDRDSAYGLLDFQSACICSEKVVTPCTVQLEFSYGQKRLLLQNLSGLDIDIINTVAHPRSPDGTEQCPIVVSLE